MQVSLVEMNMKKSAETLDTDSTPKFSALPGVQGSYSDIT